MASSSNETALLLFLTISTQPSCFLLDGLGPGPAIFHLAENLPFGGSSRWRSWQLGRGIFYPQGGEMEKDERIYNHCRDVGVSLSHGAHRNEILLKDSNASRSSESTVRRVLLLSFHPILLPIRRLCSRVAQHVLGRQQEARLSQKKFQEFQRVSHAQRLNVVLSPSASQCALLNEKLDSLVKALSEEAEAQVTFPPLSSLSSSCLPKDCVFFFNSVFSLCPDPCGLVHFTEVQSSLSSPRDTSHSSCAAALLSCFRSAFPFKAMCDLTVNPPVSELHPSNSASVSE